MRVGETALVSGATGTVGPLLVKELVRLGYQTRALVRRAHPGMFPFPVEVFEGGLEDKGVLEQAASGADVIFHLAAKLHNVNPTVKDAAEYRTVNVDGTRTLVDAASGSGSRRFIYFSTIAVYGKGSGGTEFDEGCAIRPDSWYAETKAEGERIVLTTIPGVVLRLSAVYGPRMKGNYRRLVRALSRGLFLRIGDGLNCRTVVHEHDVINAAILAAQHPSATGRVYNVTDGSVHSMNAIIAAVCTALGRRPPRAYIPVSVARPIAAIVEDTWKFAGRRAPVGRTTVSKLLEHMAVSGSRIQQELDFSPEMDLVTGWDHTITELRLNGTLQ